MDIVFVFVFVSLPFVIYENGMSSMPSLCIHLKEGGMGGSMKSSHSLSHREIAGEESGHKGCQI